MLDWCVKISGTKTVSTGPVFNLWKRKGLAGLSFWSKKKNLCRNTVKSSELDRSKRRLRVNVSFQKSLLPKVRTCESK
jgi:hypothetical protein